MKVLKINKLVAESKFYNLIKKSLILILILEIFVIGREIYIEKKEGLSARNKIDTNSEILGVQANLEESNNQKRPERNDEASFREENSTADPMQQNINKTNAIIELKAPLNEKKDNRFTDEGYERYVLQPNMVKLNDQNINLEKGTLKFRVVSDWGDNSKDTFKVLLLANFNGDDYRNLFSIVGNQTEISFDTFDKYGISGEDAANGFLGFDFFGKTFDIKIRWDFTGAEPVKQIFVNGRIVNEVNPVVVPTEKNGEFYTGPITNLEVLDYWED